MWKKEKKEWGVLAFSPFLLLTNVMLSNPFISGYKDRFLSVHFNIFLTVILIGDRMREIVRKILYSCFKTNETRRAEEARSPLRSFRSVREFSLANCRGWR